jgi:membrane-associated protease RseP (regulator of RpoE activity)
MAKRTIVVAANGSKAEVDVGRIELGAAGTVEGVVVDEKGHTIAGARVAKDRAPTWVPASGALPGVAITDSSGAFKLVDVAAGEVDLEAYAADVGRGRAEKVRVDEGRTTSGVKIVLQHSGGGNDVDLAPGGVAVTLGEVEGRIVLAGVAPGSEAERAGLLEGDDIISIDGAPVASIGAARARMSGPLGVDVIFVIRRKAGDRTIRVPREATKR